MNSQQPHQEDTITPSEQDHSPESDRRQRVAAVGEVLGGVIASRTVIAIKIEEESMQVGARKEIPYTAPRDMADYTADRRDFIKVLAAHQSVDGQHEELTPGQIWREMGREGRPDTAIVNAIRRWLNNTATYRHEPLAVWNGVRGRGSKFSINNKLYLDIPQPEADTVVEEAPVPVTSEIYEAVRHLAQFGFVLSDHHIPLAPELEIALLAYKVNPQQVKADGGTMPEYRAGALSKFRDILGDKEYARRYKVSIPVGSPEPNLVHYLEALTPDEKFLLNKLLGCHVEPVQTPHGIRLEVINDQTGMIEYIFEPKKETPIEPSKQVATVQEVQKPTQAIQKEATTTSEETVRAKLDEERAILVGMYADEAARMFLTRFRADRSYTREQLLNVFSWMTVPRVVGGRDNNILPRRSSETPGKPKFTIEDVVRLFIYTDPYLKSFIQAKSYRREVEAIIKDKIAEAIESVEKELSGEDE